MKRYRFPILVAFVTLFASAFAITPKTEVQPRWMRVTDVERTDSALRVGVKLQNLPNYWVKVSPSMRIVADGDSTLQYKLKGTENIPLDEKIWMPSSGQHEGVLIFEKVPESVKVINIVESNMNDVRNNVLGMHIDEPETRFFPKVVSMSQLTDGNQPTEPWNGLDPKRCSDLSFYDSEGKTHLKGKIVDYSPRCGFSTFSVRTNDNFKGRNEKMNVGKIAADGTFEIDLPVAYPQFNYFELGPVHRNLFLIPGDTLSIALSIATKPDPNIGYAPEYFVYEGEPDDGVAVNMLADSLLDKRYGLNTLYGRFVVKESDSMKEDTYRNIDRLSALLDSVVTDLPALLGDIPISPFAKDCLSAYAIAKISVMMEDLAMNFNYAKGPGFKKNDNDDSYHYVEGDKLDYGRVLESRLKHKDLLYNNPLLVGSDFVMTNRWEFNNLFYPATITATGFEQNPETPGSYILSQNLDSLYRASRVVLDSIGVGNCFAAQMVRNMSLIDRMRSTTEPSSDNLKRTGKLVAKAIQNCNYDRLNEILMQEYSDLVKDVMIAENSIGIPTDNSIMIDGSAEGEVLEKIIAPYRGNVLFLDFWGIGCGPCRAGMVRQKPLLEELADKPFKALYIADASEGLEESKKWLRKEEIKGEHIFVTGDNWKLLRGLFNFSGIPFGVLIGKDGKIIKTDYHLYSEEPLLQKALDE